MDDAEQLRRRLNRTKVVIFPRNTEPTEAQVRLIVEVAAHLPSHSITGARRVSLKQGGCLWVVQLSDCESTRKTLQAYYSVQQLSMDFFQDPKGWGLDQALTPQQLQQRKAESATFQQLKAAGAFPRYHGADIYVVCIDGLVPANQWDASKKLVQHRNPRPTDAEAASARAFALSAAQAEAAKRAAAAPPPPPPAAAAAAGAGSSAAAAAIPSAAATGAAATAGTKQQAQQQRPPTRAAAGLNNGPS